MGCGASKGKSDDNNAISFAKVGVLSMDRFFEQCTACKDSLEGTTSPLEDERQKLMELTGFEWIPGTKLNHMVTGMFISFAAAVNGNLSELKEQWKADPPFVFVDVSGTYDQAEAIFTSFCSYLEAAFKAITENLPGVLEEATKLPDEADRAYQAAEGEFDALDMMSKPGAVMNTTSNIAKLGQLPGIITAAIEMLKGEIEMSKTVIEEMKENWQKLESQGKTCATAGLQDPVRCYIKIFGEIPCTPEEKTATMAKMKAKCLKAEKPFVNPYEATA